MRTDWVIVGQAKRVSGTHLISQSEVEVSSNTPEKASLTLTTPSSEVQRESNSRFQAPGPDERRVRLCTHTLQLELVRARISVASS